MSSWSGKHVLVTGGASGIGLAFGRKCLASGATKLAVLDIQDTNDATETLRKEFPDKEVMFLRTDVVSKENVRRSFEEAKAQFGFIDVVLGNAGILDETEPERSILVNLMGIVHSTYAAIDLMSTTSGGRGGWIINVSSIAGLDAQPSAPAYCASKHGVLGLMRCFGEECYFTHHGLKFFTICPSFTYTSIVAKAKVRQLEFKTEMTERLKTRLFQTCDQLIEEMFRVLQFEKNGSIWLIEGGQAEEITLKKHSRV